MDRAILLAAGRGSRLASLTDHRPKCLVSLLGRPLLDHQLQALSGAGIDDVTIVGGYRRPCLSGYGSRVLANPRWSESNMVRSLLAASDQLQSSPCIAAYTDIVYSVDSVLALSCVDADIAITYDPDWRQLWSARFSDPLVDAETFRLSPDGRHLAAIGARPTSLADVEGQYMGLLRFAPAGWATVWELLALDMTSLLQRLIDEEVPVGVTPAPWPWAEIDTPEDLHLYEHDPRFAPLRAMLSDAFSRHPPLDSGLDFKW